MLFLIIKEQLLLGMMHFCNRGTTYLVIISKSSHMMALYNTNGFRTETMYDYYIVMISMFLVAKLFSNPSISYASLIILLPWTNHQNLSKPKLQFSQSLHSYHNFVQMKVSFKVTNTPLYINQKETNQETS